MLKMEHPPFYKLNPKFHRPVVKGKELFIESMFSGERVEYESGEVLAFDFTTFELLSAVNSVLEKYRDSSFSEFDVNVVGKEAANTFVKVMDEYGIPLSSDYVSTRVFLWLGPYPSNAFVNAVSYHSMFRNLAGTHRWLFAFQLSFSMFAGIDIGLFLTQHVLDFFYMSVLFAGGAGVFGFFSEKVRRRMEDVFALLQPHTTFANGVLDFLNVRNKDEQVETASVLACACYHVVSHLIENTGIGEYES
jgi:hypothetical protein